MKTITKTFNVYKFKELSEVAQERVFEIDEVNTILNDSWWETISDDEGTLILTQKEIEVFSKYHSEASEYNTLKSLENILDYGDFSLEFNFDFDEEDKEIIESIENRVKKYFKLVRDFTEDWAKEEIQDWDFLEDGELYEVNY